MKKIVLPIITFALFVGISSNTSLCASAGQAAVKYLKPTTITIKGKDLPATIEAAENIDDLKQVATKAVLNPFLKDINESGEEFLGAVQSGATNAIRTDNATKQKFVKQYVEIMNSRVHAFENRDLKKFEAEADDAWEDVKSDAITELNAIIKEKCEGSFNGCCC